MKLLILSLILIPSICFGNQISYALTPGDIDHSVTKEMICTPSFAKSRRNVPKYRKNNVYNEYLIHEHKPGDYEIDHLVSLELGGTNDIKNLWPQSYRELPGAYEKDKIENRLHWLVCHDKIDLETAQHIVRIDWINYYNELR